MRARSDQCSQCGQTESVHGSGQRQRAAASGQRALALARGRVGARTISHVPYFSFTGFDTATRYREVESIDPP